MGVFPSILKSKSFLFLPSIKVFISLDSKGSINRKTGFCPFSVIIIPYGIPVLGLTSISLTLTPPSSAGQAVVRVGEASTATQFAIRIEPPIKLS